VCLRPRAYWLQDYSSESSETFPISFYIPVAVQADVTVTAMSALQVSAVSLPLAVIRSLKSVVPPAYQAQSHDEHMLTAAPLLRSVFDKNVKEVCQDLRNCVQRICKVIVTHEQDESEE